MDNVQLDQVSQIFGLFKFSKLLWFSVGVICLIVFVKLVNYLGEKLELTFPSRRLLISQVETVLAFFTYIFGINFLFFQIINPPKELLLAAGGSIAVAVGLSMKDLVASIIAGLILLFDRPFQVGDRVSFEGEYGEIKAIGLRAVRLETLEDNLVTIPNSKFITDVVSCGNAGALEMMIVTKFHLDIKSDIIKAKSILHDVIATSKYVYLKKPIKIVITEELVLGVPCISIVGKFYVLDVKFEKAIETDVYTRAIAALNEFERPAFSNDRKISSKLQASANN